MSLTSRIDDVNSAESRFFREQFPNVTGIARLWRHRLAGTGTVRPIGSPERVDWANIGRALDYRIRYYFAETPVYRLVAAKGMRKLSSTIRMSDLFADRPQVRETWGQESGHPPIDHSRVLAVSGPSYDFCLSLEATLNESQPVGRRLSPDLEALLCRHCYVLGLFEQIHREGLGCESPLYTVKPRATAQDLLALASSCRIEDLCTLSWLFYDRHAGSSVPTPHSIPLLTAARTSGCHRPTFMPKRFADRLQRIQYKGSCFFATDLAHIGTGPAHRVSGGPLIGH